MEQQKSTNKATRRGFFAALAAGVGVAAAALGTKSQATASESNSGPVLFKRTAETERYYKTLTRN